RCVFYYCLMETADEVNRPLLRLHVNTSYILAEQPHADQLQTAKEQYRHQQRGISRNVNASDQSAHQNITRIEEGHDRSETAGIGAQAQRRNAEAGQSFNSEVQK